MNRGEFILELKELWTKEYGMEWMQQEVYWRDLIKAAETLKIR